MSGRLHFADDVCDSRYQSITLYRVCGVDSSIVPLDLFFLANLSFISHLRYVNHGY